MSWAFFLTINFEYKYHLPYHIDIRSLDGISKRINLSPCYTLLLLNETLIFLKQKEFWKVIELRSSWRVYLSDNNFNKSTIFTVQLCNIELLLVFFSQRKIHYQQQNMHWSNNCTNKCNITLHICIGKHNNFFLRLLNLYLTRKLNWNHYNTS